MFPTPVEPPLDLVALSVKAYLVQKDPFSDFLTAEEYTQFRKTGNPRYAGIGLDIEKQRNGTIIGYPLQNGPAAQAGITPGDQLLAIDGIPLQQKSLPAIAALVAGEPGATVVVEFSNPSGVRRQVSIIRAPLGAPAVSEYTFRSARIIKLPYFTPDTSRELHHLLSRWSSKAPIIIDLRGCGGGDFYAAVDSAMLFLEQGKTIGGVRDRSGLRSYSSTMPRKPPSNPVFIWQDEHTASAAEIFIAALTENGRAISVGRISSNCRKAARLF
jgi:carboxyl-terminal processing protease